VVDVVDVKNTIRARREEILAIARRHGVTELRVFGSAARGEATAASDIDFLVEVGTRRTPFFPGGLIADLESLLGCRVDVTTPDALYGPLRDRILREAVTL
jgi:predicted nucleotidyltransferase